MTRRRLRRLLAAAVAAEADLVEELCALRELELILVNVNVEQREHGPITRKTILWRQPIAAIAMQVDRARMGPDGRPVSLWAVDDSLGWVNLPDEHGGLGGSALNLYACRRPA